MLRSVIAAGSFVLLLTLTGQASLYSQKLEPTSFNPISDNLQNTLRTEEPGPEPDTRERETAYLLNMLGELYRLQGRYSEAEPLLKRSLEMRERKFGTDNLKIAESLNNLAALYNILQRYDESETLLKRSLLILENTLGPDHPSVAQNLNNLASVYRILGRFGEAIPLLMRAQEIAIKIDEENIESPNPTASP
jgi:tetratricopeptide (TPR) repeat protein